MLHWFVIFNIILFFHRLKSVSINYRSVKFFLQSLSICSCATDSAVGIVSKETGAAPVENSNTINWDNQTN